MSKPHRSLVLVLTFALAVVFSISNVGVAAAHDDHGGDRARFAPVQGELDGLSAGDLVAAAFAQFYTLPAAENPFVGGDPCVRLGKQGRVLLLTRPATCTIERGDAVVDMSGASCSDAEAPPFFAVGEEAQTRCAEQLLKDIESFLLSVDGGEQVQAARDRFAATSDQQHVTVVPGNLFDATPGPATFVGAAYVTVLRHLRVGSHTIDVATVDPNGPSTVSYTINVVRHNHGDNDDEDDD